MTTHALQGHLSRIPSELLIKVVENVPRDAARICLFINRLFHDAALPVVFGRVVLSFGAFELCRCPEEVKPRVREQLRALEKNRTRRALEILERIAGDPAFASVVKALQIQVHYYQPLEDDEDAEAIAMIKVVHSMRTGLLPAAISSLKNLRVFQWHCDHLSPTSHIIQQLVASCPSLERLEVPAFGMANLPVHLLRGVKSIRTTWSDRALIQLACQSKDPAPMLESLITDLELIFEHEYFPKDLLKILRHVPCLRSLEMACIQAIDEGPQDEIYKALQALPPGLPFFNSLAIAPSLERMTQAQLDTLCSFVKNRPRLRRFATRCFLAPEDAEPLFDALATLNKLEVLGLSLQCQDLPSKEWIRRLLKHIPAGLTALALGLEQGFVNKDTFTELWSRLPALEFVHVSVRGAAAVLTPNQFIRGASDNLRVVCFQDRFYDVETVDQGLRVVMPPWPSRKVRLRTEEDFGCKDWEWLMRYHPFFDYMPVHW
ncbi:hypothetical protein DAEQUDRAFT_814778 [Daedalea quercina L-15889]|uniref:F-box domain-containing protein n=1 Tax=Daedalea quercina L-15889 TaxID=1314783 RepID=A0A165LQG2_9APHY|nr:hypothetical protein DAEQUDRAFT_814778 [Daedalea quercina L-15889]